MTSRRPEPHLIALFPPGVSIGVAMVRPCPAPAFPEEADAMHAAIPPRRAEFLSARALARSLMSRLGVHPAPIPIGQRRAPVWPDGVVGSIAHSGDICVAAVARSSGIAALGIDLEPDEPIEESLWSTIATPGELQDIHAAASPGRRARLLFSTKESIFKALYPLTGAEPEFHDVAVSINDRASRFASRLRTIAPEIERPIRNLHGVFRLTSGWIITGAWLGAAPRQPPSMHAAYEPARL